jgi:hypothetical protein
MLIDDHIAPCLSPPSFPILPSSALLLTSAIGFLPPSTISFGDHQLWDLAARCSRLCRAYYVGCSSIPGEDLNAQPQTLKFQGPSSSKPFNSCLKFQVNTIQAQVFKPCKTIHAQGVLSCALRNVIPHNLDCLPFPLLPCPPQKPPQNIVCIQFILSQCRLIYHEVRIGSCSYFIPAPLACMMAVTCAARISVLLGSVTTFRTSVRLQS